ncbi:type VII secretion target [Mycobacterium sp. C31M]
MANLRVDPARLISAAAAEREIGSTVGSLAAGDTLHGAAAGVSQLSIGAAMSAAATAVDQVGAAASRELMAHAGKLSVAADSYRRADEALGQRLDTTVR